MKIAGRALRQNFIGKLASRLCSILAAAAVVGLALTQGIAPVNAQVAPSAFCQLPTQKSASAEETAWQVFVAINCQTNGNLAWETWTEQSCWYVPGSCNNEKKRFAHAVSLLATKGVKPAITSSGLPGCQAMYTSAVTPAVPSLNAFIPANLSANPQFCEEVYVDSQEAGFVNSPPGAKTGVNLATNTGQASYIQGSKTSLQFPSAAVEVKADWVAASSFNAASAFDCGARKPVGVFAKTIDGVCYALASIHISSKLYPNWLWATFEPQSNLTNPNRCNPKLYSSCNDSWGSNPAQSTGQTTALTKNVTNLMDQAGLAPEFRNYRLVGAQTDYNEPVKSLGLLGNSFTELNAQVPAQQASCVTCHAYAAINVVLNPPGQGVGGPIGTAPATGKPQIPSVIPGRDWVQLDFSWMLGFMPQK